MDSMPYEKALLSLCVLVCVVKDFLEGFRVDLENLDENVARCGANRSLDVDYVCKTIIVDYTWCWNLWIKDTPPKDNLPTKDIPF